jgi:tetratricopeptide (TPR) repeat protein
MRRLARLASQLFFACVLIAGRARAEGDRSAATLFDEARAAFAQKDFATAARRFEDAYREAPRGQSIYNAALSWEPASEPARAADDYALALEDPSLPASAQSHARERLAHLERALLTLRVDAAKPATVSVAHAEGRRLPATVHLPRGRHELVVHFADGPNVRQEIEGGAGEHVTIRVTPPTAPAAAAPEPAPKITASPPEAPKPSSSAQRTLGFIALGTGVAAAGGALVLGSLGLDARDRFEDSRRLDDDARSQAVGLRTWANVAWGAAAVFAVTGGVLLLTAPRSPSPKIALGVFGAAGTF